VLPALSKRAEQYYGTQIHALLFDFMGVIPYNVYCSILSKHVLLFFSS
jgi:hypothetical protein